MVDQNLLKALGSYEMAAQRAARQALLDDENRADVVNEITQLVLTAQGLQMINAIRLLGQLGDPESLDVLLSKLAHPQRLVRMSAISALKHFSSERVTQALMQQLDVEGDICVQIDLIVALEQQGAVGGFETLIRLLHSTPSSTLRYTIIHLFGQVGNLRTIPHIRPYLEDADPYVRHNAQIALNILMTNNQKPS